MIHKYMPSAGSLCDQCKPLYKSIYSLQMGNPMTPQIAVGVFSVLTSDCGQFSTLANVTILPVTTSYVGKRWKK
jgi:hypothetical protein